MLSRCCRLIVLQLDRSYIAHPGHEFRDPDRIFNHEIPGTERPLDPEISRRAAIDRQFDCRILYGRYLPTVILIIIGILSPTHSFIPGLNPSFSANPPYRSLSFVSFKIHYMDFPDCLLLLLSISVLVFFLFLHFFSCRFRAVD